MTVPITVQQIRTAAKAVGSAANLQSVLTSLDRYGADVGLDRLHRLVHYLAQLMHESGSFKFDKEIWGPTPAQQRYDTRTDLGNTPEKDGDGFLYRGRGPIQLTGKGNYTSFRDWCRRKGYRCPDFVADPDAINSDPWEGLVPIWYWDEATGQSLNRWADQNDIETITKKINGGKNGLADRIDYYGRLALVVCGYSPDVSGAKAFQRAAGFTGDAVDGDVGPKTRAALHKALLARSAASGDETVRSSPVVEETVIEKSVPVPVDRPVVPEKVEKEVRQKSSWGAWLTTAIGALGGLGTWLANANPQLIIILVGAGLLCGGIILFGGEWIVRRVKSIRREIEA
ncbi:glycoside hydrolase family 19 protein [Rhizobium sp. NTR19]|uniref:Glycoside hydrolase family 19 protein n=1 Tax=Neorhizobium turbinariae TaxID=2937795 RepID=A0ABT0IRQ4_9HYPH|nr:glycoside hydrolase family 19 protein [Neorhizobium turbinariae]MCK8780576.1 glycoside hydrolase family 19 protein [Neorhizobium turbinariae]